MRKPENIYTEDVKDILYRCWKNFKAQIDEARDDYSLPGGNRTAIGIVVVSWIMFLPIELLILTLMTILYPFYWIGVQLGIRD